mmetsp:Transcript_31804/g.123444  ORF Transcript_31804/g.123444 Transcript_31804/m.123444 type:complete len:80 (-) Transcript_31804:1642-1881(-)
MISVECAWVVSEVLVDSAIALFEENVLEKIFTEQSLFESDEIQRIFSLVGRSPSLRIDEINMAKVHHLPCRGEQDARRL